MTNNRLIQTQLFLSFMGIAFALSLGAQTSSVITLDSCQSRARQYYPLTAYYELLDKTRDLTLENLSTGNFPQISLAGKATYQSEVTGIPINIPGVDIPMVPKDQYSAYAEVEQTLTRFKTVHAQKDLAHINHKIQSKELEVSLYQLYNRVNTLYFGILLQDAQTDQSRISQQDIRLRIDQLNQARSYGSVLQSNIDQLRAEFLRLEQQILTMRSKKAQLIDVLGQLTGQTFTLETVFIPPDLPALTDEFHRPELALFELQNTGIEQQKSLYRQQLKPQLSLFAQGGYGRPSLNFLDDSFNPYFIGGLRFRWDLTAQYNKNRKMEIWDVQQQMIEASAETFKLNTQMELSQYNDEIKKYRELLAMDQEIIALRTSIRLTAGEQLARGVITSVDYMTILHEEDNARQSRALHEILLLQSHYNWIYENGN